MPHSVPDAVIFHVARPEQQPRGWACVFEARRGARVTGRITTAPLWASESDAIAASERAMAHLARSGEWPNFCSQW